MTTLVCGNQHSCPECERFDRLQRKEHARLRDELLKLRTGLARLAQKAKLADYIPGKPGREAPFEVLTKAAETNARGWNALIGVLIAEVGNPCAHCEHPEGHKEA